MVLVDFSQNKFLIVVNTSTTFTIVYWILQGIRGVKHAQSSETSKFVSSVN